MRAWVIVGAALLAGCNGDSKPAGGSESAPSASAASGPHITRRAPEVGSKRTIDRLMITNMDVQVEGMRLKVTTTEKKITEETVLQVQHGAVRKVQTRYRTAATTTDARNNFTEPLPVQGKEFVVEYGGTQVLGSAPDGGAITREEMRELQDDYGKVLGPADPFLKAIPDRPLKRGERVTELEESLDRWLTDLGDRKTRFVVDEVRATLGETTATHAAFALQVKLALRNQRRALNGKLAGEMRVRLADGWPSRIHLEGPLTVGMGVGKMEGGGSFQVTHQFGY